MDFSDGFQLSQLLVWQILYARTHKRKETKQLFIKGSPSNGVPYKTSLRTGTKLAEIGWNFADTLLPSSNFFPYKSSLRDLNCYNILYLNATDLKLGSSAYFPALFISGIHKCQELNFWVARSRDQVCQGLIPYKPLYGLPLLGLPVVVSRPA